MRFLPAIVFACLLAALSLPGGATAAPSCAEGPTTVGDTTYGTPCADLIVAPAGVEDVKAGGGDDTIVPGPITASTSCPDGCHLGVGSQTFEGGEGNDVVFGERGNDILRGGPGDDQLFGGVGDDLLEGGPGNDRLAGGFGGDSIDGQEGDDYVRGDSTIDRIFDSGGGTDALSYSTGVTPGFEGTVSVPGFPAPGGERGLRLDMRAGAKNANNGLASLGGGVDEVEAQSFEIVIGTPFSDYIIGTSTPQTIYGGGGADVLLGEGGGDTLVGGADGDNVDSGGIDTRDTGKVSVGLMTPPGATGFAQLYLVGSSGNDDVAASYGQGSVTFHLSSGTFDTGSVAGCSVTATDATCPLGEPLDSVLLAGMGGSDTITASNFPSTVPVVAIGGEGNDSITGGEESEDILVDGPGGGGDGLSALGGDDALTHNGGADDLLGGNGNDLFLSNSVCDEERIVGGSGRDNSSWAQSDEGAGANLATGIAGRPGGGEAPNCGGEPLDSLSEIEDLEGSSSKTSGDVFYGDAGPNQLLGRSGPDAYFAGAGEDSILANSGDADIAINCGPDGDSALIDHPQYGDPAPVECESVAEADPNNFRTVTQLPPPPEPAPEQPPPAVKPPRDRRPPQTRLAAHPRALVSAKEKWRQVTFRFTSSERGSSFRCKLDRKPYRPCTSPRAYRVKAGRHAFRVFAIDAAGNRDLAPAAVRFRVVHR
ncbi:MAG TPA: calcium-binding protein [Solirubrobacterales bacterium]|jgi:Ca2+-binding RTX toxin-like protein|nr:calcium-binding protein [Solirubrobacterales bacterium]